MRKQSVSLRDTRFRKVLSSLLQVLKSNLQDRQLELGDLCDLICFRLVLMVCLLSIARGCKLEVGKLPMLCTSTPIDSPIPVKVMMNFMKCLDYMLYLFPEKAKNSKGRPAIF